MYWWLYINLCFIKQAASSGQSGEGSPLGAPLVTPPQPIDIGFLLTLPDKQLQTWESILVSPRLVLV